LTRLRPAFVWQYTQPVATAAPLVQLSGVAARVGAATILRDVNLEVAAGEAVAIYGANGSGKTTVLRIVATLMPVVAGAIHLFGENVVSAAGHDIRTRIGLIGHTPALYPELSLRDNLSYVARVAGLEGSAVDEALRTVGLGAAAERAVSAASHGMQRRCEIARELMRQPDLLLLDEPHSALDDAAVELVAHLVDKVIDAGGCVLVASHDRRHVDELTGRQLILAGGALS